MMSFDEARTFAKARGFRSYLNLLDWLVENYGVPFKGEVVWPNDEMRDRHLKTNPAGERKR